MDTAVQYGVKEVVNVLGMTDDVKDPLNTERSCYFFINKYKIEVQW